MKFPFSLPCLVIALGLSVPMAGAQNLVSPAAAAQPSVSAQLASGIVRVGETPSATETFRRELCAPAESQSKIANGTPELPGAPVPSERVLESLGLAGPLRTVPVSQSSAAALESTVDELGKHLDLVSAVYGLDSQPAKTSDCAALSDLIRRRVTAEPAKILEIVEAEVRANPGCACEIVKAAVKGSEADAQTAATIVEAASVANPDTMRTASQCVMAMVPDALAEIQSVLARLDPNAGKPGHSAKDSKDAKGAKVALAPPAAPAFADPLDLPRYTAPVVPVPMGPPPVSPAYGYP